MVVRAVLCYSATGTDFSGVSCRAITHSADEGDAWRAEIFKALVG